MIGLIVIFIAAGLTSCIRREEAKAEFGRVEVGEADVKGAELASQGVGRDDIESVKVVILGNVSIWKAAVDAVSDSAASSCVNIGKAIRGMLPLVATSF